MKYSEVRFTCKGGEAWHRDVLMHDLADIGFETFESHNDGFNAYIPSEQLDFQALESLLIHQPIGFEVTYAVREILPENWNAVWESNFEPVIVADQCYVRATFHPSKPHYPYEIVIDPKMAFGTGHHQTTSLVMCYMLEESFEGKEVLDMGCGTGILAILAAKMGASRIWAIDNDPVCIDSVVENMELNHTPAIIAKCGTADLISDEKFDVILANINRNVLLDQLNRYAQSLREGGVLYISGFYDGNDLEVLRTSGANHALEYDNHRALDGWAAACFKKRE